jgi:BirA family biotin operon repressor/biotin-[acetyl-CoA-carboxylase] ligase
MSRLDEKILRRSLPEFSASRLEELELFARIGSTNTHLLGKTPPGVGRCRVAIADHQSTGRGRHNRLWLSPPGAGLYLSLAYSFAVQPKALASLTLALGVGIVGALQKLHIAGVSLKWPNDIVALDGKLGGVLTEVQSVKDAMCTVVTGVGINIKLPESLGVDVESGWAQRAVDLQTIAPDHPPREEIAALLIDALCATMTEFEAQGFAGFVDDWRQHDWLHGRQITVDMPNQQVAGVAAGIDADGALLVDTGSKRIRVISGSIVLTRGGVRS